MHTATKRQSSEIYRHLIAGSEQACREYVRDLREQQGASVLTVCEHLTEAFHAVGEAWACSEISIYREHVASQIGQRLLSDLRVDSPSLAESALKAIGCTAEGDPYSLPTLMVELVFQELGWQARSLGSNLPLEFLEPAIAQLRPGVCWVSVSHVNSDARLAEQLSFLAECGRKHGVEILCGGQALKNEMRIGISDITFLNELRDIEDFVSAVTDRRTGAIFSCRGR
jgi:methanogenic corrinoid protein MtbC1